MSDSSSVQKKDDRIVVAEQSTSTIFERFKHGDFYTSRDVEEYAEGVVEQIRKARPEEEIQAIVENAVPSDSDKDKKKDKKRDSLSSFEQNFRAVVPDFSEKKFEELMDDVEQREIEEKQYALERADTDEIYAVIPEEEEEMIREERELAEQGRREARESFNELRHRVVEKIEEKFLNDPTLDGWKKKHLRFFEKFLGNEEKGHIRLASDLDGVQEVVRGDRVLVRTVGIEKVATYSETEKQSYIEGVKAYQKLESSPYIIGIRAFDAEHGQAVVDYKKFKPLNQFIKENVDKEDKDARDPKKIDKFIGPKPDVYLSFVRDAMRGALHAKKAGVGIQDIALHNISIIEADETGGTHGSLTDVEGMYPLNTALETRMGASESGSSSIDQLAPTGVSLPESPYHPPEVNASKVFRESEMVFQFGVSLRILGDQINIEKKLTTPEDRARWYSLVHDCTAYNTEATSVEGALKPRLSLVDAEQALTSFIEKIRT